MIDMIKNSEGQRDSLRIWLAFCKFINNVFLTAGKIDFGINSGGFGTNSGGFGINSVRFGTNSVHSGTNSDVLAPR